MFTLVKDVKPVMSVKCRNGGFQELHGHEDTGNGEMRDGETNGEARGVSSSLSSLIKVSPLKSLLREDLRRRISARGRARARGSNVCLYF